MTIEEIKKKYGSENENGYIYCGNCPLYTTDDCICKDGGSCSNCDGYDDAYIRIRNFLNANAVEDNGTASNDNVNHPSHYETGKFECIDVMIETQGIEAVKNFCICNAFKYLYRAKKKNGLEDYKKAKWYLEKYIELEGKENDTE